MFPYIRIDIEAVDKTTKPIQQIENRINKSFRSMRKGATITSSVIRQATMSVTGQTKQITDSYSNLGKTSNTLAKQTTKTVSSQKEIASSMGKNIGVTSSLNKGLVSTAKSHKEVINATKATVASMHREYETSTQVGSQLSKLRRIRGDSNAELTKHQERISKVVQSQRNMIQGQTRVISSSQKLSKADKYLDFLLKAKDSSYKKATRSASAMAFQQGALTEITKTGGKTISKTMKEELKLRAKQITEMRKISPEISTAAKAHNNAILAMNEGLKRHTTLQGRALGGLQKTGKGIKTVGLAFLTLLGPIFLVGAALRTLKGITDWVIQPFIKFEDALYELRKTAKLTQEAMLEIGSAIEIMSLRIPVAADELGKIAATAGRLGIRGKEDILTFTETVAMMAVATVLTAEEAAEGLARIRQAFGIPVDQVEYLGSVINELSNTTASNSRDIVESLGNIGAAGKMLLITADQAAAMSATLISSGMSASRSGCVDSETEILTKDGWKGIDEMSEDDFIATRNPNGYLEYRKPELIYRRNWNGDMIHLKTSRADILVTPDHRMMITTPYINYEKKVEAKSLLERNRFGIPRTCKWKGKNIKYFTLPSVNYYNNQRGIISTVPKRKIPMKDWCEFMGYFLSDGSITQRGNDYGTIEISQKDGIIKDKIWECIIKIGYNPRNHKDKGVLISNKQLFKALKNFVGVKSLNKYVPIYIKDLNIKYLHIFLEAFIDGDGSRYSNGSKKVFTSSPNLLNDIWEIALKLGYQVSEGRGKSGFNGSNSYVLYLGKQKYAFFHKYRNNIKVEHYSGRIWCPVLPPHETILIKRNGKVAWTYQTRIRRMLTEVARNADKMADAMKIDAEVMREALEDDPMKALMMYLEHLNKVESNLDKLKEAHNIFGKVGGFAIAALAENYEELEKNIKTANDEMVWGTSLQEEFAIATDKTSAQLQLLTNRAELARREMGENFIPVLIWSKKVGVDLTETLSILTKGMAALAGKTDTATTAMDVYVDEWLKLEEIKDRPIKTQKEALDEWRPGIWTSTKDLQDLMRALNQVGLTAEETSRQEELADTIRKKATLSLRKLSDEAIRYGKIEDARMHPLREYINFMKVKDDILQGIVDSTDDLAIKERGFVKLQVIENTLFREGSKVAIEFGDDLEDLGLDTIEIKEAAHDLTRYLEKEEEKFSDVSGEMMNVKDAMEVLNNMSKRYTETTIKTALAQVEYRKEIEDLTFAHINVAQLERERIRLTDELANETLDLFSASSQLTSMYFSMYDNLDRILDIEEGANKATRRLIRTWTDEVSAIDNLISISQELSSIENESEKQSKKRTASTIIAKQAENLLNQAKAQGLNIETDYWQRVEDLIISSKELNKLDDESTKNFLLRSSAIFENAAAQLILNRAERERTDIGREDQKQFMSWFEAKSKTWGPSLAHVEDTTKAFENQFDAISETEGEIDKVIEDIGKIDLSSHIKELDEVIQQYDFIKKDAQDISQEIQDWVKTLEILPPEKIIETKLDRETFDEDIIKLQGDLAAETFGIKLDITKITGLPKIFEWVGVGEVGEEPETTGLQKGGSILKTGIYKLHAGEEVIPAKETGKNNVNISISFPNMIISRDMDLEKVRSKLIRIVDEELSQKLSR